MNSSAPRQIRLHIARSDRSTPLLPVAAAALVAAGDTATAVPNERIYGELIQSLRDLFIFVDQMAEADVVFCAHDISEHSAAAHDVSRAAKACGKSAFFHSESDNECPTRSVHGVVYRSSTRATWRRPHEQVATGCVPDLTLERSKTMSDWVAWDECPSLGFMGHVTHGFRSLAYLRKGWANFYGFRLREQALRAFEGSPLVKTAFTRRSMNLGPPMAGTSGSDLRAAMRQQYVDSVFNNSYSLCIRGAGNWSYRFFEALSAGRIPVMIDTDCMLPLEDEIDWSRHICRIPYAQIARAPAILREFHHNLGPQGFATMQRANRNLWVEQLEPSAFFLRVIERFAQGRLTTNP